MKKCLKPLLAVVVPMLLVSCAENNDVIASVADKDISKSSFNAYLQFKRVDQNNSDRVSAHLGQYLNREALAQAIETSNVIDQAQVNTELNEFKKEMLIARYFEKFMLEQVSDTAIRNYYAANIEQFESKRAQASHILIRTNKNTTEAERKVKYTRAHQAYSQLKAGADFSAVVAEFSEDTISAKKDGSLGWLNQGAIDPVFSKTIFSELKAGEISPPIQTSFGFHIVKLISAPAIIKKPLAKVKGDIRHQLRKQIKDAEMARLLSSVDIQRNDT